MSKKLKILSVLVLCILLTAAVFPTAALAQGKVNTEQPVSVTVSYHDGEKAIPNARFRVYRVAKMNEYGEVSLTKAFEAYRSTVDGLADPNSLTQEQWGPVISTLRAYVLRDGIPFTAEGMTDENGTLEFPELSAGAYLFLGSRATTEDFYTYTAAPFMLLLPGRNSEKNDWDYEVTAEPKFTKEYNPPDDDDKVITRKVLKRWDDEGYESVRPKEITVQLLKDGKVYDTQKLNKENNWRYAWDNLDSEHEWLVAEKEPEGYAVTIEQTGITFTVSNKFVAPIIGANPPVQKRITGDKPQTTAAFTFVMEAKSESYPMPEGSTGTVKQITILGAGSMEFGEITFPGPGCYEYTIYEVNGEIKGYTYDTSVYTITYDVVQENGELSYTSRIEKGNGNRVNAIEFTNPYKTPDPELPYTGALWWPVPVLLGAGLVFVLIGVIRRRKMNG